MKQVESAGVVVYREHNNCVEYLILHYQAGHWDFPKGHLEAGETKLQAAERELMEEAGIKAEIVDGFQDSFSYVLHEQNELVNKTVYFFIGKAANNEITLSHEHTDFAWLSYQEAFEKLTYQNAQKLLSKVNEFLIGVL